MTGQELNLGHDVRQQIAMPGNPLNLWGALMVLLALGGLAIAGPWGVMAWHENAAALDTRSQEIALLEEEIAALENRVALLDPDNADPDLAGELVRRNLGVLHEDEVVVTLPDE